MAGFGGARLIVSGKVPRIFFFVIAWFTIWPAEAFAYLDPGTGSLVVQSVIAALAAVGYAVRLHWSRIRMWFHRPGGETDSPSDPPSMGPG